MREFLLRRLRRAPAIQPLWDEYDRMQAARDAALAERDAALADRAAALAARDAAVAERDAERGNNDVQRNVADATPNRYSTSEYILWAYRLLLGREPEQSALLAARPHTSRRDIVELFITSVEFSVRNAVDDIPAPAVPYMVELKDGFRFWLMFGDKYVSPAMAAGNFEPTETAFVTRQVQQGMAVVDIGANLGWFTVHLAQLVGSKGRVDAFEPRTDLFDLLSRTVRENHVANVTLHNCALAAKNAHGKMIWSLEDFNPGGSYLALDFTSSETKSQPVLVQTLDTCIAHRIDFIKIDVEGSEPLVFEGAKRIMTEDRPTILAEINPENLVRAGALSIERFGYFANAYDYQLYGIAEDGSCGKPIPISRLSEIRTVVNVAMLPNERAI